MPAEPHGDKGNILLGRLARAAAAGGTTLAEAAWNIPRTLLASVEPRVPDEGLDPLVTHPVLVWDVDGILAFTSEGLCGALNARFGTTYSPLSQEFFPGTLLTSRLPPEQGRWVDGLFREPAFLATLAPDFHALDTLADACEAGWDCVVCTERPPDVAEATAAWLADWGVHGLVVHAVGHGNKSAWMAAHYGPGHAAVLIDDNPAMQVTVAGPGVEVWAPQRPYTPALKRSHVREFGTWAQGRHWLGLGPQP